jgi:hypothetical protein
VDGRDLIVIDDREGITEGAVAVSPVAFVIATLLDGRRDLRDVQAEFARRAGGAVLPADDLRRVVDDLDRHGLLDSETFGAKRQALVAAFRAATTRPSSLAGAAYPTDTAELRAMLDAHVAAVDAGALAGLAPRAIVAPHIDFTRGAWCYAWAHVALAQTRPQTYVVLGVAHTAPPSPVILTRKGYTTPLGTMPLDADAADELERRLGDLTEHELAHRAEHSIEFQVVFLQALNGHRSATLLPILCSSWEQWVAPGQSPRDVDTVERVVQAVRALVAARAGEVAVVASVDLSHVGPRFGDGEPVSPALATKTSVRDREVLDAIVAGDAELFWRRATAGGNPTRIDAVSATYLTMRVLEPARGRLLKYGQAEDPAGGIVSFASLALS